MADWQQQELSIRMSALEACNPHEIFSEEVEIIISATLSTLSEQTRRAFILSRFENKSNKEIAEEMEISIKGGGISYIKSIKGITDHLKRLSSPVLFFLLLLESPCFCVIPECKNEISFIFSNLHLGLSST